MKTARMFALAALLLTVGPAALFAAGALGEGAMKAAMLLGAVLWFAAAPLWLRGASD
jgi:hypothetical protein